MRRLISGSCLPPSAFCPFACSRASAACKVTCLIPNSPRFAKLVRRSELMSNESISASEAAAAQDFPDRVGFNPDNPLLATFRPYIPAGVWLRELTLLPLIIGTLLGMVFGASSLYLVLKVGLTVSASIPVAVISITLFRLASKIKHFLLLVAVTVIELPAGDGASLAFLRAYPTFGSSPIRAGVALSILIVVTGLLAALLSRIVPRTI